MVDPKLNELREEIDKTNSQLLELISRRARIGLEVGRRKAELGLAGFDPVRESGMLNRLAAMNPGPFSDAAIRTLFKALFQATLDLQNAANRQNLLVSRKHRAENTIVTVGNAAVGSAVGGAAVSGTDVGSAAVGSAEAGASATQVGAAQIATGTPANAEAVTSQATLCHIGGGGCQIVAGPCSVENEDQLEAIASYLAKTGIKLMRGGAYKPRSSPYSFQGLGLEGLRTLRRVADRHGLAVVSEVLDPRDVEAVSELADIVQIGARNMYNYPLLREVGRCSRPVLLKRSFSATLEELLLSAEYIFTEGNEKVILCERGIRSFDNWTRNTLDISSIPLLKQESHLPVMVDVSHAAGRRDILPQLARAAVAAGADALMVEVHNNPAIALSDNQQQLDLPGFTALLQGLKPLLG